MGQRVSVRRAIVVLGLAAAVGAAVWAQERPDFTGSWVLREVDPPHAPAGGFSGIGDVGRPGLEPFGGRPAADDPDERSRRRRMPPMAKGAIVHLTQSDSELVLRFSGHERVYRIGEADGALVPLDETAAERDPEATRSSRTYWDGADLVTEIEETIETRRGVETLSSKEVRSLSGDDETMTVTSTVEAGRGSRTIIQTFTRRDE